MKIIFDSENQKYKFLKVLGDAEYKCPRHCGFKELSSNNCTPATKDNCVKCWEQCGIEFEVKSDEAHPSIKEQMLIDIPADGSYVEILGHKIYGDWKKDGEDAFVNFCTYLQNVKDVYERNERLRKLLIKKTSFNALTEAVSDAYLTPNDVRWICGEEEIKDHPVINFMNDYKLAYGTNESNMDVQLMSKEEWMSKRLDDISKAIELKTKMLQIVPITWYNEYNELVAKLKVEDEDE